MRDEETLQHDYKNLNERLVIINLVCFLAIPMLISLTDYRLSSDILGLFGILSALNFICYIKATNSEGESIMKYLISLLPYFAITAISLFALKTPLISEIGTSSLSLDTANPNLLVSASTSNIDIFNFVLRFLGIASMSLVVYFLCNSFFMLSKVAFYAIISSFICCIIGFVLELLELDTAFINIERVSIHSFFSFINPTHWCVYATLSIGIASLAISKCQQRFRVLRFLKSKKFIILMMQFVLYLSVYMTNLKLYTLIASIVLLASMLGIIKDSFPSERLKIKRSKFRTHAPIQQAIVPISFYILTIFALIAISAICTMDILQSPNSILNTPSLSSETRAFIAQDLSPLLETRQFFGWGVASFGNIFSFVQSSDIGSVPWAYPCSDLMFIRAELGFVGLILLLITPIVTTIYSLMKAHFTIEIISPAISLIAVTILMIYASPMQSPLVQALYLLCLFTTLRWIRTEN